MIELDIFSDTVCPWCYIGKKRLEKAIEKHSHLEIKQTWRPFQLNPGMPPDGMDRQEYLVSKFGSADAAKTIYDNIFEEGKKEGIDFNFDSIEVTPNSFNSLYTSTTLVLRVSGQFSLKVKPNIKILESFICIPALMSIFIILFATKLPILSFTRLPLKMTSG